MTDIRTKEQIKADRNERARLRMAEYYKSQAYRDWYANSRDQRNARKEKYRRQAGILPKGSKTKEKKLASEEKMRIADAVANAWCESHVKRFYYLKNAREKYAKRYIESHEEEKQRSRKSKADLKNAYIRQQLRGMGISNEAMTPELIELKREQLILRRLSREAEQAAVKQMENEHETI